MDNFISRLFGLETAYHRRSQRIRCKAPLVRPDPIPPNIQMAVQTTQQEHEPNISEFGAVKKMFPNPPSPSIYECCDRAATRGHPSLPLLSDILHVSTSDDATFLVVVCPRARSLAVRHLADRRPREPPTASTARLITMSCDSNANCLKLAPITCCSHTGVPIPDNGAPTWLPLLSQLSTQPNCALVSTAPSAAEDDGSAAQGATRVRLLWHSAHEVLFFESHGPSSKSRHFLGNKRVT